MKRGRIMRTKTLSAFNNGQTLTPVLVQDEEGERVGIRDALSGRVWGTYAMTHEALPPGARWTPIVLPPVPPSYGKKVDKWVGGVSRTVRLEGILRARETNRSSNEDSIVLFAIGGVNREELCAALQDAPATLRETEEDEEYGFVTEVVVERQHVHHVAALIARTGDIPMFENPKEDACRALGIERLDRTDTQATVDETVMEVQSDDIYGPRRPSGNFLYGFIPNHWLPPLTWDHLAANVADIAKVRDLPEPLRTHVASYRIRNGLFKTMGTLWARMDPQPTKPGAYTVIAQPPIALIRGLADGAMEFNEDVMFGMRVTARTIVRADDGMWYIATDTAQSLRRWTCGKRKVSCALDKAQSEQLIQCFYLLSVEQVQDPIICNAARQVMFRYLIGRGYTARWIGKYLQKAQHVGNGDTLRRFNRLSQYNTHQLPSQVLNRLCEINGHLKSRGSNGTRSKYKTRSNKKRYVPKRRMNRTLDDERQMVTSHSLE